MTQSFSVFEAQDSNARKQQGGCCLAAAGRDAVSGWVAVEAVAIVLAAGVLERPRRGADERRRSRYD